MNRAIPRAALLLSFLAAAATTGGCKKEQESLVLVIAPARGPGTPAVTNLKSLTLTAVPGPKGRIRSCDAVGGRLAVGSACTCPGASPATCRSSRAPRRKPGASVSGAPASSPSTRRASPAPSSSRWSPTTTPARPARPGAAARAAAARWHRWTGTAVDRRNRHRGHRWNRHRGNRRKRHRGNRRNRHRGNRRNRHRGNRRNRHRGRRWHRHRGHRWQRRYGRIRRHDGHGRHGGLPVDRELPDVRRTPRPTARTPTSTRSRSLRTGSSSRAPATTGA